MVLHVFVTLSIQIISWVSFAPIFVLEYENNFWTSRIYTIMQQVITHQMGLSVGLFEGISH